MKKILILLTLFSFSALAQEAFDSKEAQLIRRHSKNIQKIKDGYLVTPDSGTAIYKKNCNVVETCGNAWVDYKLKDIVNERYLVLELGDYEFLPSYEVIDVKNGYTISLAAYPHFSADFKMIIATKADEVAGAAIELYELLADQYKPVLSVSTDFEPMKEFSNIKFTLPKFHSWVNNYKIRLVDEDEKGKAQNMLLYLDVKEKKWRYEKTSERFMRLPLE